MVDVLREMTQVFVRAANEPNVKAAVEKIVGIVPGERASVEDVQVFNDAIKSFDGDMDSLMKGLVQAMKYENYPRPHSSTSPQPHSTMRDAAAWHNFRLAKAVAEHAPEGFNFERAAYRATEISQVMNHGSTLRREADKRAALTSDNLTHPTANLV